VTQDLDRLLEQARIRLDARCSAFERSIKVNSTLMFCALLTATMVTAHVVDRLPRLTLPELPVLVLTSIALVTAFLTLHRLDEQIQWIGLNHFQLPRVHGVFARIEARFADELLRLRCTLDAMAWHRAVLSGPAGALAAPLSAALITISIWRAGFQLPRVVEAFASHIRTLIDTMSLFAAELRHAIEGFSRPGLRFALAEAGAVALSDVRHRGRIDTPLSLNLRC
jgi:hypothetical protein